MGTTNKPSRTRIKFTEKILREWRKTCISCKAVKATVHSKTFSLPECVLQNGQSNSRSVACPSFVVQIGLVGWLFDSGVSKAIEKKTKEKWSAEESESEGEIKNLWRCFKVSNEMKCKTFCIQTFLLRKQNSQSLLREYFSCFKWYQESRLQPASNTCLVCYANYFLLKVSFFKLKTLGKKTET